MNIKAITFDVGGTLIEPWPSVGRVYAEVAARFGVNGLNADELTQSFVRAWKAQTQFDYGRESWFAVVRETFGEHARRLPPKFFPAVYNRFAEADTWRIYDDAFPALEVLARRGIKLGIISNWDERLRPLLTALKLDRHFASIIVSCEAGATKPDPALFTQAARKLGVASAELLHVGDSHPLDVKGAESAGANGRHLVRGGTASGPGQIRSLAELSALAGGD